MRSFEYQVVSEGLGECPPELLLTLGRGSLALGLAFPAPVLSQRCLAVAGAGKNPQSFIKACDGKRLDERGHRELFRVIPTLTFSSWYVGSTFEKRISKK